MSVLKADVKSKAERVVELYGLYTHITEALDAIQHKQSVSYEFSVRCWDQYNHEHQKFNCPIPSSVKGSISEALQDQRDSIVAELSELLNIADKNSIS